MNKYLYYIKLIELGLKSFLCLIQQNKKIVWIRQFSFQAIVWSQYKTHLLYQSFYSNNKLQDSSTTYNGLNYPS